MNQILVTEKLYVTPELKRAKNMYKIYFCLSILIVCLLFSYYIYAEYDRNKSEEVSQDILMGIIETEDNTTIPKEEAIIVFLDEEDSNAEPQVLEIPKPLEDTYRTSNGKVYNTVGIINIPSLKINYPILAKTTDAWLKVAPCKFWGPDPNEVGNLCIAGHNYRNNKFFSKISKLENGDIIEITDLSGKMIQYKVYKQYQVKPEDVSCTSQNTDGKREVTLITCTNDNKKRVIIKAVEYYEDKE